MLLTVVFSNECNLDCSYCCIGYKNNSPILSTDDATSFLSKYIKRYEENTIEFYGGEPFVQYEKIIETINFVKLNFKESEYYFRVYTNGMFLERLNQDGLVNLFDEIFVSLDGFGFENNCARFKTIEEYTSVLNGLIKLSKHDNNPTVLSTVLSSERQYKEMFDSYKSFLQIYNIRHFSYEPITVFNDDKTIVIPKRRLLLFLENILKISLDMFNKEDRGSLFVAKELMSAKWYDPEQGKRCSDVARAISPRGNIYMCRDFAANEENMFHRPNIIQFHNKNTLKMENGRFESIEKIEGAYTPCVVKDLQYSKSEKIDELYWLNKEWQDLVIRPMYQIISAVNDETSDSEFYKNMIQEYLDHIPVLDKYLS